MRQNIIIGGLVISLLTVYIMWINRPDNGVYGVGKNAVLISGECIMINWDATEDEAKSALEIWKNYRKGEK